MESRRKKSLFATIRGMDLTKGNLFLKLGIFALPMALTTILQLLYTTIDLVSVHYWGGGETSASAISANGALINLVVVVFSGLAVGANIAISNALGAKNPAKAERILHTSLIFAPVLGILIGVFAYFMTPTFLEWVRIDEAYKIEATTYMQIYFIGLPFLMIYNFVSQIHRASGDSGTPFFALVVAGLLNVGFDLLFVAAFHANVAGVAWATVISEAISGVILLTNLSIRKSFVIHLDVRKLKIDPESLSEVVKLGLPAGLQGFFFALPNTFIQSALFQIGAGNLALQNGAIAANNINNYNYAFIEALSASTMVIIAQNYGAKKVENIKKAILYGLLWGLGYCALYDVLILTAYRPLLSLFVDHGNDAAIEAGRERLWLVGLTYVLDMGMDVASGAMKGMRKPLIPTIVTALTCSLFRILAIELVILRIPYFQTVLWLYSVFPFSWILACIADFSILPFVCKKEFAKLELAER